MKNKPDVYIIGAGGFGREIESWISISQDFNEHYLIKGYLDDNPNALNGYPSDYKVLGNIDNFHFKCSDYVLLGIADPEIKDNIVFRLRNKVSFLSFISDKTIIGKFVDIGEGTVIAPNCFIINNIVIGRFVTINVGTIVGHDSIISDFSSIMANVNISGGIKLENHVFVGSNATILPGKKVGNNAKISAGSVVITDIPDRSFAFGNPAKIIHKHL